MLRPLPILILLIIPLLILIPAQASSSELDRVVAVVNKEVITRSELYREMEREFSRQEKPLTDMERARLFKDNEAVVLEALIDIRLQLQEADRLGIHVSDKEVDKAIKDIMTLNSVDAEQFNEALRQEGLTIEEYRKTLREEIALRRVIDLEVISKVTVGEAELKQYMGEDADASEEDTLRIKQIFFKRPEPSAEGIVEERAKMVYDRLSKGEDFQSLAMQYSEAKEPGSIRIKKSELSGEFVEALKTMKPGDVSRPFWTGQGLHIIKLEPVSETAYMEEARRAIVTKRLPEEHRLWIKRLREKSFIEIRL